MKYLDGISKKVHWIARNVEQNPTNPRVSSKLSYDMVAYDVMILRLRYQRTSFRASTDAKIEYLLSLLDEIASFYAQQSASGKGGRQENAKPVTAQNAAPPHR